MDKNKAVFEIYTYVCHQEKYNVYNNLKFQEEISEIKEVDSSAIDYQTDSRRDLQQCQILSLQLSFYTVL